MGSEMWRRDRGQGFDEAMRRSLDEMAEAAKSEEFREGIAAWKDKRAPNFTGT